MEKRVEKITAAKIVFYIGMWLTLIVAMVMTCGREQRGPVVVTDDLVQLDSTHFFIYPEEPDTLNYIVVRAENDNMIKIYCIETADTEYMIVESAYIPEYSPGTTFTMIKGQ